MDSILETIKSMLAINANDHSFDAELVVHINTAINYLAQLGIGPVEGYCITGPSETWNDFVPNNLTVQMMKSYIFLKTKLVFDPPNNSFVTESINKQIQEIEWRLIAQKEAIDG